MFVALAIGGQRPLPEMPRIGIRAFKQERILEVWGANTDKGPYSLLASYPIAAISGDVGPKRREGDMQVPEGFYYINRFNPNSQFHLSLGLNYPNSSDRKLGDRRNPGRDIFIHGNEVSAGCLAMTDPVIEVIYHMAEHARDAGQRAIPVSIFPCRMTAEKTAKLYTSYSSHPDLIAFWSTLQPGYDYFEQTHFWPRPHVDKAGYYTWPELKRH
jgi:murein L,D-transpeptidase YafK